MSDLPISLVIDGLDIEWNGGKYDAIELHEPTIRQLEKAYSELKAGTNIQTLTRFQIALICEVSGKPRQIIELMPVSKIRAAFNYLEGFINANQTTGD